MLACRNLSTLGGSMAVSRAPLSATQKVLGNTASRYPGGRTANKNSNCCWKRKNSSSSSGGEKKANVSAASSSASIEVPTHGQLMRVFSHAAVPMIGFGIMDQTVMIQAGNAIDCTIGVLFGLSTLSAAAIGQICSDASGVVFGGTVERLAKAAGLPSPNLTPAQAKLPIVARAAFAGSFCGIILGCTIGLVNLLFIDTSRSSTLKLQAFNEGQDCEFTVEISNDIRPDATTLTVEGPDVDGVLASMTAALAQQRCSIVEISAKRAPSKDDKVGSKLALSYSGKIKCVFYVLDQESGEPFDDDKLEVVAKALLEATRTPLGNFDFVKTAVVHNKLEEESPLDSSFSETFKLLEKRMSVVRQNSNDSEAPGLTRRVTVVRHLPKEDRVTHDSSSSGQK